MANYVFAYSGGKAWPPTMDARWTSMDPLFSIGVH